MPESPLALGAKSLKAALANASEAHDRLKKAIRGEADPGADATSVDDTTDIHNLLKELRNAKDREKLVEFEAEERQRVNERELESLRAKVRQRDFYLRQEPIVFKRPPKSGRGAATQGNCSRFDRCRSPHRSGVFGRQAHLSVVGAGTL